MVITRDDESVEAWPVEHPFSLQIPIAAKLIAFAPWTLCDGIQTRRAASVDRRVIRRERQSPPVAQVSVRGDSNIA